MAFPLNPGSIIRVTAWCVDGEQASASTWFYNTLAVGAFPATDQDVATTVDAAISTPFKAIINNVATYQGTIAQIVWPLPIVVDQAATAGAGNGTAGNVPLPRQTTGITSWYTAFARQANRGRTYWPFPATADDTPNGVPTNGYVTAIQALGAAISGVSAIAVSGRTATIQMGIYHRKLHTITPIVLRLSRQVWATQRRRGSYGRGNKSPI